MSFDHAPLNELPSLGPRGVDCRIPLAAPQLYWWKALPKWGYGVRPLASAVRITGNLDVKLLHSCLQMLVDRHESLRIRFAIDDIGVRQHVRTRAELGLSIIDLSNTATNSFGTVRRIAEEILDRNFDPIAGPLFAAHLFRLSSNAHVLLFAADHLISDVISLKILEREAWTLYAWRAREAPLNLPPIAIQFPDYAVWQDRTYVLWKSRNEEYWRTRLAGAPSAAIPYDHGHIDAPQLAEGTMNVAFGKQLSDKLLEAARKQGTSLPIALLALYACVLARWCGRDDFLIAFVSHGRYSHPELKGMIGFLASLLHLRIQILADDRFCDLLTRVRSEFDAALMHYDFGHVCNLIPDCATELRFNWLPGATSRSDDARRPQTDTSLRLQPVIFRTARGGKFAIFFSDTPAGVNVGISYRPDLLAQSAVRQFADHLRLLARCFVEQPSVRLSSVPCSFAQSSTQSPSVAPEDGLR
jgi:hypothetical protein